MPSARRRPAHQLELRRAGAAPHAARSRRPRSDAGRRRCDRREPRFRAAGPSARSDKWALRRPGTAADRSRGYVGTGKPARRGRSRRNWLFVRRLGWRATQGLVWPVSPSERGLARPVTVGPPRKRIAKALESRRGHRRSWLGCERNDFESRLQRTHSLTVASRWSHHRSDAGFRLIDRLRPPLVATPCCHSTGNHNWIALRWMAVRLLRPAGQPRPGCRAPHAAAQRWLPGGNLHRFHSAVGDSPDPGRREMLRDRVAALGQVP